MNIELTQEEMDRLETLWQENHSVTIEHLHDQSARVTIDIRGVFQGDTLMLPWQTMRGLGGNERDVMMMKYKPWFFGLFKTQTVYIDTRNLAASSAEIIELIRLGYNSWIDSLNADELKQFTDGL